MIYYLIIITYYLLLLLFIITIIVLQLNQTSQPYSYCHKSLCVKIQMFT